ncbi:hypothetical protein [Wielerella bovis]|nr:hypothetical protein [Wielerella bovis]
MKHDIFPILKVGGYQGVYLRDRPARSKLNLSLLFRLPVYSGR